VLKHARNGLAAAAGLSVAIKVLAWALAPMIPLFFVLLVVVAFAERVATRRK